MDYKKELEIALTCYIAEKHTQEECTGFIAGFEALQKVVKNINYDAVLAPVFYTDDYLKWLNKYFVKVDKVFEYCQANKKEYFTKEQLHKRYEKAMLESPFK